MRFINSAKLEYSNAIKDGNVVNRGKDNTITMPTDGTTISFSGMAANRGNYSILMTVKKGSATKTSIIVLR
tara:strand:+ start:808 stop:1020 length:213 start_codon:yes stop_codon:yes gene_type:complete